MPVSSLYKYVIIGVLLKRLHYIYTFQPEVWSLFLKINLFIYFWLCWVFASVRGFSLVVASGGHSSSWCAGLSLSRLLLLRSTGPRRAGSVVAANGHSCSAARGIFPDQGWNPCPLHWQADSQPLHHEGSPWSLDLTPALQVFHDSLWEGIYKMRGPIWLGVGQSHPCFLRKQGPWITNFNIVWIINKGGQKIKLWHDLSC